MDFVFKREVVLQNDRVLLRPLQEGDFSYLLTVAIEDEKLLQYSPTPNHTPELLKDYIQIALQDRIKGIRYPFCIYDKVAGAFAGSTSIANVSNYDKRLEIGWTWLGKGFQQSGLNRNCKYLLLEYIFETLQFERVEFRTDDRNKASRTALEKLGAKFEGVLRSHMVMNDGYRRNTCYYSILTKEWPRIKAEMFK